MARRARVSQGKLALRQLEHYRGTLSKRIVFWDDDKPTGRAASHRIFFQRQRSHTCTEEEGPGCLLPGGWGACMPQKRRSFEAFWRAQSPPFREHRTRLVICPHPRDRSPKHLNSYAMQATQPCLPLINHHLITTYLTNAYRRRFARAFSTWLSYTRLGSPNLASRPFARVL